MLTKKELEKSGNNLCTCGHRLNQHDPDPKSHNYIAGQCLIPECKCLHFLQMPDSGRPMWQHTYQVIAHEPTLHNFIDNFLPDLLPNETFYVCLFARNKYCKELTHIKSDKAQLKRFTANKQNLFDKIKQLEVPYGSYKQKEHIVPQNALALYIHPNPRNFVTAAHRSLITLATLIGKKADGYNPHAHVLSDIQRSCSRKIWIDFDIDSLNPLDPGLKYYDPLVLRSRGGYHLLIDPRRISLEYRNSWYQAVLNLTHTDQAGDQMIPVPGCYQGGIDHYPYIQTFDEYLALEQLKPKPPVE